MKKTQANLKDFLGLKFKKYKCSRCRKEHIRMAWDKESSMTCPRCTNETGL